MPNYELNYRLGYSLNSIRPRSEMSASIDWSSLNGIESIVLDRTENGSVSAASHATTLQPGGWKSEDSHPNLTDYFYDQIKFTES